MGSHDQVQHQAHGEAHGFPASPDTQTTQQCFGTTTCFGAVDVRYVEGGEDLYRTLACFHLSKPYAALMVDDLDLILLRGGEEHKKKKSAARERGSAFGATEARLARASALMKNAAESRPPDFTVVCAIEKADGAAPVPYLDTMKRWFDRVVEIGSHGGAGGSASVWAGTPPRDREDEVLSGLRAASSALGFQVNPL